MGPEVSVVSSSIAYDIDRLGAYLGKCSSPAPRGVPSVSSVRVRHVAAGTSVPPGFRSARGGHRSRSSVCATSVGGTTSVSPSCSSYAGGMHHTARDDRAHIRESFAASGAQAVRPLEDLRSVLGCNVGRSQSSGGTTSIPGSDRTSSSGFYQRRPVTARESLVSEPMAPPGPAASLGIDASALDRKSAPETWEASSLVAPPWGRARANRDRPLQEEISQKQQTYQRHLTDQAVAKAAVAKSRAEEDAGLDARTGRSLAPTSEGWGIEALNAPLERAVFGELLATVAHKRHKATETKSVELRDFARWKEASDRQMAHEWHEQKRRAMQEKMDLAGVWRAAVHDKQRRQEEERVRTLRTEKEAVRRVMEGVAPPRRMRKPCRELQR
eukprot:CAMPEP_0176257196 /NCGR_PEP_ID=MMETSP0121_2-20121125/37927_1 /TAXON_ID=160619 /ORGANISM="Kryptoperidinium foliaceum, Strain CCMP 1326" /LENGTH=384 /DNA_ID=CAMNT_0017597037 /DNA_START=81 /DNA_END=1235 /DNA_ORIENTATION=+